MPSAALKTEHESLFKLMCDVTDKICDIQERFGGDDDCDELKMIFMHKLRSPSVTLLSPFASL